MNKNISNLIMPLILLSLAVLAGFYQNEQAENVIGFFSLWIFLLYFGIAAFDDESKTLKPLNKHIQFARITAMITAVWIFASAGWYWLATAWLLIAIADSGERLRGEKKA